MKGLGADQPGRGADPAGVAHQCATLEGIAEHPSDAYGDAARMGEGPVAAAGAAGGAYNIPAQDASMLQSSSGSSHGGDGKKSEAREDDAVIRAATRQGTGEGSKGSKKGKQSKRDRGGKENGQGGKAAPKGQPKRQKKAGR